MISPTMFSFSSHLQWFQAKIGSYDKQMWETSVEQRILQGLENRPKRDGSLHKELIDIDLVRGSTFSKAKPRHGLKSVIFNGLKRVIFFPYYFTIWRKHLNREVVYCILVHYIIQMIQLILYSLWSNSCEIMLEEILLPVVLALSLGVLHAHISPSTVKQRRKKTFSTSSNKSKTMSKTEVQQSVTIPTQISDSSQQVTKDNSKPDVIQTCQEKPLSCRSKKKIVFAKSTSHLSNFTDEEESVNIEKTVLQSEGYDGETETKDSSSSEFDEVAFKNGDIDVTGVTKLGDINEPGYTEVVYNSILSSKIGSKRIKSQESCEKTVSYNKMKPNIRKSCQSEVVTVTDEEDLKNFITAKNKHIPDPTPITSNKKDKEKTNWKTINGATPKPYKTPKTRHQIQDWVGTNSAVISCSSPIPIEISKTNKSASTESTIAAASEDTGSNIILNSTVINQDTDHSYENKLSTTTCTIETLTAKTPLEQPSQEHNFIQQKSCHSQPHTPINHAGNRSKYRIEVRKVSSADASPTPSRRNSNSFPILGSLDRDMELKPNTEEQLNNQTMLRSSHYQGSISDALNIQRVVINTATSSEDLFPKVVDINEDTITKCHKKRDEYQQMFANKAKVVKSISSTSSSRNSVSETKHGKIKRRNRDENKLVTVELKSKLSKEMVLSMSETEYDRMNSDVNSTCNSSSDGEDICPRVGVTKSKTEEVPGVSELKEDEYEEDIAEIGGSAYVLGKNENNVVTEDDSRPIQSDDFFHSEINPDEPFVLWYKEAQGQGVSGLVSCYVWENNELKKTNLSLLDIGWSIIQAVKRQEQDKSYSSLGFFTIIVLCFTPLIFRMYTNRSHLAMALDMSRRSNLLEVLLPQNNSFIHSIISGITANTSIAVVKTSLGNLSNDHVYSWSNDIIPLVVTSVLASEWPVRFIILFGVLLRLFLYTMTFLMLCVAENSFEQRLQYAKHFCRLTSSRRARKYYLPHFRLNKLANIKCWLSLRSYLKKRGPQRSVESIVSSAFYMLLIMLSLACVNLLQSTDNLFINRLINWDLMLCSVALGVFMMRFLVLGTKITKKYRNLSVIITEQINLFLAMQTRPHKKEELTLAHNVLRLAESLLKEVEGPFRVCGWSMNPFLYNILKVVILSVFSTVLSETCGFKMKLYKIKINPANW